MAESTDASQDAGQDTKGDSVGSSGEDWEAKAKHFQSLADKRDADYKALQSEFDALKKAQEDAHTRELQKKEEFKQLYEESEKKLAEAQRVAADLNLRVKLQEHLANEHPEYAPDFRWIHPHVTSEEEIASVTEEYVKAHPRTPGQGTASMGNKGAGEGGEMATGADLADPAKVAEFVAKHPELSEKLARGEITIS